MSTLLVVLMVLGTGAAHHTTTFLRLTARRSDQGIWTARFGEYEISIELRHHLTAGQIGDYNDTWTVKVKHTPKHFVLWDEKEEEENEVTDDVTQEPPLEVPDIEQAWNSIDNENDTPVLRKMETLPRKSKKGKKRRQLSNKFPTTTTEKNDMTLEESSDKEGSLSELAQGSTRINVVFDKEANDSAIEESTKTPKTHDDGQWKNIAAIIYDGSSINPAIVNNDSNQYENMQKSYESDLGRSNEPYALPLQQSFQIDDYDKVDDPSLSQNVEISNNHNTNLWGVPKDVTDEYQARKMLEEASDETDETSRKETIQSGYDYVVEDPAESAYDVSDENEETSDENGKEIDFSDLETTPEMTRLAQWYPRSKPLVSGNNGYKLFPGVGWFKLVPWAERWSDASKVCDKDGAHLAVPDTREKVKIFLQIFNNYPDVLERSILSEQVYVGVYNSGGYRRDFHTVQDEVFRPEFPIWFPGEPDNADPGEDCVTFHKRGKIRDVPCFYNLPFLCEKAPDIS